MITKLREKCDNSTKFQHFLLIIDKIYCSDFYLAFLVLISVVGFSFKLEIAAMGILIVLIAGSMAFTKNITATFVSICFISVVPLGFYGASGKEFISLFFIAPLLLFAIIFRFIIFPAKYKPDKFFYSQLVYSIALYLGGIGTIAVANYFRIMALYAMFGVGLLQLFFIFFFSAYLKEVNKNTVVYFAKAMVGLCCAISLIYIVQYILELPEFKEAGFYLIYRQYKNNFGNYYLLCLPFCFYLAAKRKFGAIYFLVGFIAYAIMLITKCRGAQLFGTAMLPFMVLFSFIKAPKERRKSLYAAFGCVVIVGIVILSMFSKEILEALGSKDILDDTGRFPLYKEAIRLFLINPVFGGGVGHLNTAVYPNMPKMGIFYFHSTFFQLIGATGLVGLFSYAAVTFYRWKAFNYKSSLNIFVFLGYLGFASYSMVNTGTMSPFPFLLMVTFFTVLVMRYNATQQQQERDKLNLQIP